MSVSMLDNIGYKGKKPDNVRSYFETVADMAAFSENYLPDVYVALCGEDGKQYKFIRSNEVDPVTGKWRVLGEGGSADLINYYTKAQVNNLLNTKVDAETGKGLSSEDFTAEEKSKLSGLENYDDTNISDRIDTVETGIARLNGDATVNGSVDKKVASCLSDSKSYTDTSVQNAIRQTAIACDAKPTISGTTITYVVDGVTCSITSDNKTKFYYTAGGTNYSTIWIEGKEFTDTVASVDFTDYVSKANDLISTYTGSEADKTKVPTVASLDALKSLVDSDIDGKVGFSDIDSAVTSESENPVSSSALYQKFSEKVDVNQGASNAGKILKVNSAGDLVLSEATAGADAADVSYTNAEHSDMNTVKKALDGILAKLYYVEPKINSFTMTPSTAEYEVGQTVSEVSFAWAYNKDVVSQTLTDCTLADNTVRTATYSTPISSNKTFTLTASDGEKSVTASKSISFKWKAYWGSAATPAEFTSAFVTGLSGSKLATTYKGTYNITVGSGQYGFVCCPASWNMPNTCKIGGFGTDLVNCGTFSITNASGGTTTYKVVRTTQMNLGAIQMLFE
jgi:hypothetical protein